MALAPLSQTLILTEDGTALTVGTQVTIPPPSVVLPTLDNTDEGSTLDESLIAGAPAIFVGILAEIRGQTDSLTLLSSRVANLEN